MPGFAAWHETQRDCTIAFTVAKETGFGPVPLEAPAAISIATGIVMNDTAPIESEERPGSTTGCVFARKFITYLSEAPKTKSTTTTTQACAWPYSDGKWFDNIVKSTGSVR